MIAQRKPEIVPAGVDPILRTGRNAWRDAVAEDSGVLVDAADYYRAFYRSAATAKRHILMSGWQFDSGVELLRGPEVPANAEVRLLKFLNGLCEQKPELRVYLLAWDFHLVFAGEREWMQRVYFHWMTNSRFQFLFDKCPLPGGSHHQKFVVIDGAIGFAGGMDVCEARWDDRGHRGDNPLRTNRGACSMPYHDVQAYLFGREAVGVLEEAFWERWVHAGGERLPPVLFEEPARLPPPQGLIEVGRSRVYFSRTAPCVDEAETVREVETQLVDAIGAATRLVYIETQYFSSRKLCEALTARMKDPAKPRLEIVVVVNERADKLKEEIAVGLRQARNLEHLRQVACETGHALGLYFSLCEGVTEDFRATYIHSKVMVVDDRYLTVGSANFTNRSMGLDSELHVSWEASHDDVRLARRIRRVRISLLAEHAGLSGFSDVRRLWSIEGLVHRLEEIAGRRGARLQRHGPPTPSQTIIMELINPEDLPFDPEIGATADRGDDEPVEDALGSDGLRLNDAVQVIRRLVQG